MAPSGKILGSRQTYVREVEVVASMDEESVEHDILKHPDLCVVVRSRRGE